MTKNIDKTLENAVLNGIFHVLVRLHFLDGRAAFSRLVSFFRICLLNNTVTRRKVLSIKAASSSRLLFFTLGLGDFDANKSSFQQRKKKLGEMFKKKKLLNKAAVLQPLSIFSTNLNHLQLLSNTLLRRNSFFNPLGYTVKQVGADAGASDLLKFFFYTLFFFLSNQKLF